VRKILMFDVEDASDLTIIRQSEVVNPEYVESPSPLAAVRALMEKLTPEERQIVLEGDVYKQPYYPRWERMAEVKTPRQSLAMGRRVARNAAGR
jgi:hypothetical protein